MAKKTLTLFEQWNALAEMERPEAQLREFWTEYYAIEKNAYEKLLGEKKKKLKGTFKEVADYLSMDPVIFVGFIEGINTSLKKEFAGLEEVTEETEIELNIDMEKLYFNMLKNKADWLYQLPQWDDILTEEQRKEITREYRVSGMVINENKTGRNDPCPCGSGKKYKKCCGQAS